MRRLAGWLGWTGAAVMRAAACGARSELPAAFGEVPPPSEGGGGAGPECAVYNSTATLSPLDLFVMIDLSGSMAESVDDAGGPSKWEAVRKALTGFLYDGESAGIGISIGFFPIVNNSASQLCVDSVADCGLPDPCTDLFACGTAPATCQTQADCVDSGFPNEPCVWLGVCSSSGQDCRPDAGLLCPQGETCIPLGYCENRMVCDVDAYADLPIDLQVLPSAADDVYDELVDQLSPAVGTPALRGVSQRALDHIATEGMPNTIVLLATDGAPTAGDPNTPDPAVDIDDLVDVAESTRAGGVRTFVVGVFSPTDPDNLIDNVQRIAEAGGIEEAFIIETGQGVSEAFREALNQIRLDANACEFTILTDEDDPIDYDDVWVRIDDDGDEVWVERRDSPDACDPDAGGFYFEPPPETGAETVRIVLCPSSCTLLGATANRQAEVYTTCPDPVP